MSLLILGDSATGVSRFEQHISKLTTLEVKAENFTTVQQQSIEDANIIILHSDGTGTSNDMNSTAQQLMLDKLNEGTLSLIVFEYIEYQTTLSCFSLLKPYLPLRRTSGTVDNRQYNVAANFVDDYGVLEGINFPFNVNVANSICSVNSNSILAIGTDTSSELAFHKDLNIAHFSCAPTYQNCANFDSFAQSPFSKILCNILESFSSAGLLREKEVEIMDQGSITADLKKAFNNPDLSNVKFVTSDGVTVHASKWLLSLRSTFFRSMFNSEMLESSQDEIQVDDPSKTFLPMIEFMYTDNIEFKDKAYKDIVDILEIADKYVLIGMRKQCEKYLCAHIDDSNIFDLLLNQRIEYSTLKKRAIRYFLLRKKKLLQMDEAQEFLNYPELLMEMLKMA